MDIVIYLLSVSKNTMTAMYCNNMVVGEVTSGHVTVGENGQKVDMCVVHWSTSGE